MKESRQVGPVEYSATSPGAQNKGSVEVEHEEKPLVHTRDNAAIDRGELTSLR